MASKRSSSEPAGFARFVDEVEPRLRRALVATYGVADGRQAAADALSWAWEHWAEVREMANPAGYLYRVGQSAIRRYAVKPLPGELLRRADVELPGFAPELPAALARLSEQQRAVVVLVHAFGWSQREEAAVLGVSISTVREHLSRALLRLRRELEATDVR